MAVESVAAASSGSVTPDSGQSSEQDRISELVRLEQDVQKLKNDYKDKAKNSGISQSEINSKIRKYEKLIAKVEQEIRQIKKKVSSQPIGQNGGRKEEGVYARGRDSTGLSMAALKASYRRLLPTAQTVSEDDQAELETPVKTNLDQLV